MSTMHGLYNIDSGEVKIPKNGTTAPMLKISANDKIIINKNNNLICFLRRRLICPHRRNSKELIFKKRHP